MMQPSITIAPYGAWKSPISSDMIVSSNLAFGQIVLDGETVYWEEGRPAENGRSALVKWSPEKGIADVVPPAFNVRSRVHEYGGGAYNVYDGVVYFVNFTDQQLYRQLPDQEPQALTAAPQMRYADMVLDAPRHRLICVREDHSGDGEAVSTIVAIALDGTIALDGEPGAGTVLLSGNDFYSSPRISPDGTQLAWLTWHHPHMPWDGTELWVGQWAETGQIAQPERVAGGSAESVTQPEWSPEGVLHFVSDRSEWWNLYRWQQGAVEALYPMEAEFAQPQWVFGMTAYGFASENAIICSYTQNGFWYLARLDTENNTFTPIPTPYATIGSRGNLKVGAGHVVFNASSATTPTRNVRLNLATEAMQVLCQETNMTIPTPVLSEPEAITFLTENGRFSHAFYYPPKNDGYQAPAAEKPPIIVISHGGPTSATKRKTQPRHSLLD